MSLASAISSSWGRTFHTIWIWKRWCHIRGFPVKYYYTYVYFARAYHLVQNVENSPTPFPTIGSEQAVLGQGLYVTQYCFGVPHLNGRAGSSISATHRHQRGALFSAVKNNSIFARWTWEEGNWKASKLSSHLRVFLCCPGGESLTRICTKCFGRLI